MKHMLRSVTFAMALLALAASANAASNQFGVKGGVAIQELGGDDADDFESQMENRSGFVGGAYFQSDFSDNFGLRVEGLYFMKGASGDSAGVELTIKLDYLEFPVLLMGHLPLGESGRISLFGGPTVGFNMNSEAEASFMGASASFDIGDAISSFELGLTFGAGLSFNVGSVILGVDGRYGYGLTTVVDDDIDIDEDGIPDFGGEDFDVINQGFAVMASIGFPLGAE